MGFGGSPEPRGAGPALPGGPVSGGTVPPPDRLAPEPGPERAGGGAGHRLRAALGRRGRAPLRRGWAGRPGRPAARERGRQAAAGGRGRGGAAGRTGRAARRRRGGGGAEGGEGPGGPAPPAEGGLGRGRRVGRGRAARLGREARPQRGWDYLKKLGDSAQRPRPRHAEAASLEEQAAYKKSWPPRWTSTARRSPGGRSRSGPSTSTGSA